MIPDKFERKGKFRFVEAWKFPKDVTEFLKDLFKSLDIPNEDLVHLCSGKSKLGKIRIDIDTSLKQPTHYGDIIKMSKTKRWRKKAKNTLADFPWQISYQDRRYFGYAIRDFTKLGGYIVVNSPWNPWVTGLLFMRCYKVYQAFNSYRDLVDMWIFKRVR